ncbi:radical SAM protein [Helicobacter sp. T3_23-1059]
MNLHKTLTREQYCVYKQRVVEYYVRNKFYGVHNLQRAMGKGKDDGAIAIFKPIKSTLKTLGKITSFVIPHSKSRKSFRNAVFKAIDLIPTNRYQIERLKTTLDFRLRGKIYLPQVEFAITTTCNLKCKNCTNYIPYLPRENQRVIAYTDFKTYLQNLLKNADKLNALLLLGGEPLLHKELPQMLDFALNCEKIESVYITTNGTIYFSDALRAVFEKHKGNKKLWIWVSNYTANPRLAKRLKSYDLVAYLREQRMNYIFINDNVWGKSPPPTYAEIERTDEQNSAYFLACNSPCVSVYGDELSICPRASHFAAKGTIHQKAQDLASVAQIGGGIYVWIQKIYRLNLANLSNLCDLVERLARQIYLPFTHIQILARVDFATFLISAKPAPLRFKSGRNEQ